MSRFRSLSLLLALGVVIAAALLSRSPAVQSVSGSLVLSHTASPEAAAAATNVPAVDTPPHPTPQPPTPTSPAREASPDTPDLQALPASDVDRDRDLGPSADAADDVALQTTMEWSPPPLPVPLARHPNDHYWFIRPIRSNHINTGLLRYPYGSDGSRHHLRVHHGIDISNPVGTEILAVADGIVAEAGSGHFNEWESITSYGYAVSIEHDVGYQGKKLFTLYAHLSEVLVEAGQRVKAGDVIGLVGQTGQASGPHLHFEVRLERNAWRSVRNPDLWLAPYTGTGTIAGYVGFASGASAQNVEVVVVDLATGRTILRTTTYASGEVFPDDRWQENFVLPNVPVGRYRLSASYGALQWSGEVQVQEGLTNWVQMDLLDANPPEAG